MDKEVVVKKASIIMGEFKISGDIAKSNINDLQSKLNDAGCKITSTLNSVFDNYDTDKDLTLEVSEQFSMVKELGIDSASYNDKTHERKEDGIHVTLDDVWGKDKETRPIGAKIVNGDDGYGNIEDISKYQTADAVLNKLLELRGYVIGDDKKDQLIADLIKYNISMFDKNGNVLLDADWSKLDFPQDSDLESVYGATKKTNVGDETNQAEDNEEVNTNSTMDVARQFKKANNKNDEDRIDVYYNISEDDYNKDTIMAILETGVFDNRSDYNNYDKEHRAKAVVVFQRLAKAIVEKAESCGIKADENINELKHFYTDGNVTYGKGEFDSDKYKKNSYSDGELYDAVMPLINAVKELIKDKENFAD